MADQQQTYGGVAMTDDQFNDFVAKNQKTLEALEANMAARDYDMLKASIRSNMSLAQSNLAKAARANGVATGLDTIGGDLASALNYLPGNAALQGIAQSRMGKAAIGQAQDLVNTAEDVDRLNRKFANWDLYGQQAQQQKEQAEDIQKRADTVSARAQEPVEVATGKKSEATTTAQAQAAKKQAELGQAGAGAAGIVGLKAAASARDNAQNILAQQESLKRQDEQTGLSMDTKAQAEREAALDTQARQRDNQQSYRVGTSQKEVQDMQLVREKEEADRLREAGGGTAAGATGDAGASAKNAENEVAAAQWTEADDNSLPEKASAAGLTPNDQQRLTEWMKTADNSLKAQLKTLLDKRDYQGIQDLISSDENLKIINETIYSPIRG